MMPGDAGNGVERRVETHDARDAFGLHHGHVNGVARRETRVPELKVLGTLYCRCLNWEHVVDHGVQGIEGRLDGIAAADGHVAMENLLEYFCIGHKALAGCC